MRDRLGDEMLSAWRATYYGICAAREIHGTQHLWSSETGRCVYCGTGHAEWSNRSTPAVVAAPLAKKRGHGFFSRLRRSGDRTSPRIAS